MISFTNILKDYINLRRKLGYKLKSLEPYLVKFVAFLEEQNASHITVDHTLRWAIQPSEAQRAQRATRLGMARRFAQYVSTVDPLTEIPPKRLLLHKIIRKTPHIYTDDEIQRIRNAANHLFSLKGIRKRTYATLFGLIAVTGLRISEAISRKYSVKT